MPTVISKTDLPTVIYKTDLPIDFTYKQAYCLLNDSEKNNVREAIIKLGISKETFYKWLRDDKVPFIWRQHFKEQLNIHLNANGKNLL
jgi:ACT domain-containing protein